MKITKSMIHLKVPQLSIFLSPFNVSKVARYASIHLPVVMISSWQQLALKPTRAMLSEDLYSITKVLESKLPKAVGRSLATIMLLMEQKMI